MDDRINRINDRLDRMIESLQKMNEDIKGMTLQISRDTKGMTLQISRDTKGGIDLIRRKAWWTIFAIAFFGFLLLMEMIVGFSYLIKRQNDLTAKIENMTTGTESSIDRAITEIRQIAIDIREKAGVQQK